MVYPMPQGGRKMGLALMCLSLQALRYCVDRVEKPLNEAKAAIAKKEQRIKWKISAGSVLRKGL